MLLLVLALADTMTGASRPAPAPAPLTTAMPAAPTASDPAPAGAEQPSAQPNSAAASSPAASETPAPAQSTGLIAAPSEDMAQPRDPWVKVNRVIFSFDVALERNLLAPVAHGYVHVVPHVVRYHVTNALFNVEEPLTAVNDLLQLRIGAMSRTVFRFVVNSTLGIAGLFDVAKSSGVPIHFSLFGQTLGRYGVKAGPYVMLPILGPSDVRDGVGRIVDGFIDPATLLIGGLTSTEGLSLFLAEGIDWRSRSDDTLKAVYSATDPYAFVRSAYTQSREAAVSEATGKATALPDFDAVPGTP